MVVVLTSWWPLVEVNLIYIDILMPLWQEVFLNSTPVAVGVKQPIEKPNLTRALTEHRHGQVPPEGDACACVHGRTFLWAPLWSTHGWAQPEAVCSAAWCGSWVTETRKPCSLKDSEISYSCPNGDVSECKRRQWSKNERRPQPQGPYRSVNLTLCLCNLMFMQWNGLDCAEVDGSGAVAAEGVGMVCTHLALITIFQRKLDCWREHSIYI